MFCVSGAISIGDAHFGEGSGPIIGGIVCTGTEPNVTQCSPGSVGQRDCHHGRDVGVICQGHLAAEDLHCMVGGRLGIISELKPVNQPNGQCLLYNREENIEWSVIHSISRTPWPL